jgi:hypothetical protein
VTPKKPGHDTRSNIATWFCNDFRCNGRMKAIQSDFTSSSRDETRANIFMCVYFSSPLTCCWLKLEPEHHTREINPTTTKRHFSILRTCSCRSWMTQCRTTNSKTNAPSIYFERSETVHEQSADANERNLSRIQ